jgi:hypothetical protein
VEQAENILKRFPCNRIKPCSTVNVEMSSTTHQSTKLENTTFNIISQLDKDATFLYRTADTYIEDAQRDGRQDVVNIWNTIKEDKMKHIQMLREALANEAKRGKLRE